MRNADRDIPWKTLSYAVMEMDKNAERRTPDEEQAWEKLEQWAAENRHNTNNQKQMTENENNNKSAKYLLGKGGYKHRPHFSDLCLWKKKMLATHHIKINKCH